MQTEKSLATAASKAGMDEKTARKYRDLGRLPSPLKKERTWRTRKDPFQEVWYELREMLELNPKLQAKTLFQYLQREYPGKFQDGQIRTFQQKVKTWRALEGPPKEVYFPQVHYPGRLCQSDFTSMSSLGITIQGQPFPHMIYHFVLTYSNWETGTICFSECFESLSEGLQNALWKLGGVPKMHQSDRLSAAVNNQCDAEEFTASYTALLNHYRIEGRKIQADCANENGDVEQRHHRFKIAVEQSLLLRGSKDFISHQEYRKFLNKLFHQLNAGRQERFDEELKVLGRLPVRRLDDYKRLTVRVRASSTIRVHNNVYSVNSRLIGEQVIVHLYSDHLEIWYAQKKVETHTRLRGEGKYSVNYRHIIDWLVRKPGAFENYLYKASLFPSHYFRMAYDVLVETRPHKASREYLEILYLAARESESGVEDALRFLFDKDRKISPQEVEAILKSSEKISRITDVEIQDIDLNVYDLLMEEKEVVPC
jgi:hypothetical protein